MQTTKKNCGVLCTYALSIFGNAYDKSSISLFDLSSQVGFAWEGQVLTGSSTGNARVVARFQAGKDQSTFSNMLEYKIVQDVETEI